MKEVFNSEIRLFGLKRSGNAAMVAFFKGLCEEQGLIHHHNTNLKITKSIKQKYGGRGLNYLNLSEHLYLWEAKIVLENSNSEYNRKKKDIADSFNCDFFSKRSLNVLLLRTPHNHLASLLKSRLGNKKKWFETFGHFWKHYAEEALGITNYLGDDKIVVLYDKWFESRDYREELSENLGYVYTDRMEEWINSIFRMGSSFDGKKFQGRAQEMKVLNRWIYFSDNDIYLKHLNEPFIIDATKELFGIDIRGLLKL